MKFRKQIFGFFAFCLLLTTSLPTTAREKAKSDTPCVSTCGASAASTTSAACGVSSPSCGTTATSAKSPACGVSSEACGVSSQLCGTAATSAKTPACGVSSEACGVSSEACGVSGQSCGMPVTIDFDPAAYASAAEAHPSAGDLGLQGLDTFLEPVRARYKVPALAVAVARSGGVFAAGAVGVRVAGMEDRVTIVDQFHLGSCTKSVTATVAAALVEDGKIQWETTIADVFPALVAQMRPEYRDVTLAQLLSHRSGLPAQDCALLAHGWALEGDTKTQRGEFARLALQLEPAATPGTAFLYTDIGYIVAGVMLEVVADRSWEDLVREDVGRRLGLESLGFGEPAQPGKMDQPWGHVTDGARVLPFPPGPYAMMDNPMVIAPAGLLHLSILDWGKYATEHLKGARGEDTVLLRSGDYEALQADTYHQQYGYGWGVSKGERGALLTHTGSCGEWYSMIWIAPDLDLAIVAATNISGGNGMAACRDALQVAQTEFIHD